MTETVQTPPYKIGPDEKAAHVLAYSQNTLYGGDVVVKQVIRVSTWLRTYSVPDRISLFNAKVMPTTAGAAVKTSSFREINIATSEIQAFHLLPPSRDPLDYDPSEPNRHMVPIVILVANFRVDGHLRLTFQTTIGQYLDMVREEYCSVYDATITHPQLPSMGNIHVPFMLIRLKSSLFAMP